MTLVTLMICIIPATDVSSSERRPTAPLMLLSHCGEYPCESKKNDIRGKFARNDTIGQANY